MSTILDTRIYQALKSYYVKPVPMASGLICGAVSIEAALRCIGNIFSLMDSSISAKTKDALKKEVSENLSKAVLYGLCATNCVPGSAFIGAVIFSCRSLLSSKAKTDKEFVLSQWIRVPIAAAIDCVITPALTYAAIPTAGTAHGIMKGGLNLVHLRPDRAWYGIMAFAPAYYFRNHIQCGLTKMAEWSSRFFLSIQ